MRRLTLKKDTLTELSTDELAGVVGGEITTVEIATWRVCPLSGMYPTLPVADCLTTL